MTKEELDALQALADTTRKEADKWDDEGYPGPWLTMHEQSDAIDSLVARIRELEGDTGKSAEALDAVRYRWLKENADIILDREVGYSVSGSGNMIYTKMPADDEMDRAIDAAISAGRATEGGKEGGITQDHFPGVEKMVKRDHIEDGRGMVGAQEAEWVNARDRLPVCDEDTIYIGVNDAGFVSAFTSITQTPSKINNGHVYINCYYDTAEEHVHVMNGLKLWRKTDLPRG